MERVHFDPFKFFNGSVFYRINETQILDFLHVVSALISMATSSWQVVKLTFKLQQAKLLSLRRDCIS